jgi:hypothetical protein
MTEPGYPAARAIAPRLQAHFSHQLRLSAANHPGAPGLVAAPDLSDIEAIVDTAFWASLRREEGYVPKISLALASPDSVDHPLLFGTSLPLHPTSLVRVAPAVERPGIHLGVWREQGELRVWGTTRSIPPSSFVLEVAAPGLLVVKHHRGDGGKYVNVAVLEGDQIKIIDERASAVADCPAMLTSLLGFEHRGEGNASIDVLIDLAVSMRGHGRGGIILIVPAANDDWTASIVHPVPYAVQPRFTVLADLLERSNNEHNNREWQEELEDTVNAVAGLTAVDGATILNSRCELLAFGAKISRRKGSPLVEQVALTEPIEGGEAAVVSPSQLGGTRHLSAAQFVHDQRDTMALVASQDGRFTIFAWSPCETRVHAHRVETLLL